jgi:hypothetical protein
MPWLRRLVAGLSPWMPGFTPWSVHVVFVVDKVALGQVFLRVLWFFSLSIIPPWLSILTSFGGRTVDVLVSAAQRHSPPIDMNMNISQLLLDSQEGVCLMELVIQIDNIHFKLLNVMIEWLTLLLCRRFLVQILAWNQAILTVVFHGFLLSLQVNARIAP